MNNEVTTWWLKNLAVKLREWAAKNRYKPYSRLARELDIPISSWNRILNGYCVVRDSQYYARIHVRTGLEEADPRTIPPDYKRIPKGIVIEIPRKMTDDEWKEWRANYKEKATTRQPRAKAPTRRVRPIRTISSSLPLPYHPAILESPQPTLLSPQPQAEPAAPQPPAPAPQPELPRLDTLGKAVDFVLSLHSNQMADAIVAQVTTQLTPLFERLERSLERLEETRSQQGQVLRPSRNSSHKEDVSSLSRALFKALTPALRGSAADRNRLIAEHGRDLGRLIPYLEAFKESEHVREQRLAQIVEVEL